jgi:hypothetical protein
VVRRPHADDPTERAMKRACEAQGSRRHGQRRPVRAAGCPGAQQPGGTRRFGLGLVVDVEHDGAGAPGTFFVVVGGVLRPHAAEQGVEPQVDAVRQPPVASSSRRIEPSSIRAGRSTTRERSAAR